MSTVDLQNAIAQLIRHPDTFRGEDFPEFAKGFELTPVEFEQLTTLSLDNNVKKFGYVMQGGRINGLYRQLKLVGQFLPENIIHRLVVTVFDPIAGHINAQNYSVEFMKTLIENPEAKSILAELNLPVHFDDLLRYEYTQLLFRRQTLDSADITDPGRLIQHRCFQVLDLTYDIPSLMRKTNQIPDSKLTCHEAERRPHTLLFLGDRDLPKFRTFEIDEETAKFLQREFDAAAHGLPPIDHAKLPDSYSDLVEVGLTKQLN